MFGERFCSKLWVTGTQGSCGEAEKQRKKTSTNKISNHEQIGPRVHAGRMTCWTSIRHHFSHTSTHTSCFIVLHSPQGPGGGVIQSYDLKEIRQSEKGKISHSGDTYSLDARAPRCHMVFFLGATLYAGNIHLAGLIPCQRIVNETPHASTAGLA